MKRIWLLTAVILAAATCMAGHPRQHGPYLACAGLPAATFSHVEVELRGEGFPARISVFTYGTASNVMVVDAAQTGADGYLRQELYRTTGSQIISSCSVWDATRPPFRMTTSLSTSR